MKDWASTILVAVVLGFPSAASGMPGDLDPSFSNNGRTAEGLNRYGDFAPGVALMPDGRIVVAGSLERFGDGIGISRYLQNGTLDRSFADHGHFRSDFGFEGGPSLRAFAVLPDGGLVLLVGRLLFRLLPDGQLDPRFSADGRVEVTGQDHSESPPVKWEMLAFDVAAQTDGKVLVVGFAIRGPDARFAVARYLPSGELDPSFSGDGLAEPQFARGSVYGASVEVQDDGKLVIGGTAGVPFEVALAVIRLLPDGSPDPDFSEDGLAEVQLGEPPRGDPGPAMLAQDGSIYIGGQALARIRPSGALDPTFPVMPLRNVTFAPSPDSGVYIARSVRSCYERLVCKENVRLDRLSLDGSSDSRFSGDGTAIVDLAPNASGETVAVQPDGRVVVISTRRPDRFAFHVDGFTMLRFHTGRGQPNADADGLRDKHDSCPAAYGSKALAGCPSVPRSLSTLTFSHTPTGGTRIHGVLMGNKPTCVNRRTVSLFRKQKGRDRRVRTRQIRTEVLSSKAEFHFRTPNRTGQYYAALPTEVQLPFGICTAARSDVLGL